MDQESANNVYAGSTESLFQWPYLGNVSEFWKTVRRLINLKGTIFGLKKICARKGGGTRMLIGGNLKSEIRRWVL